MWASWPPTNPAVFAVLFAGMWCVVCLALAMIGGWRRLAEQYRAVDVFEGERWRFRSAGIGWVSYNNCLTVGANATGLYLAVLVPFRLGHPPLFIPWSDIDASEQQRLGFKHFEFRCRQAPSVAIRMYGGLGPTLLNAGRREGITTWQVVG